MSGHFILSNISQADLDNARAHGGTWSPLQHGNIGWNANSRAVLSRALNNQDIPNRDGLPPHRYLILQQAGNPNIEVTKKFLQETQDSWVDPNRLRRPTGRGLGLRALNATAAGLWAQNKLHDCLVAQFWRPESATVTVEIYHLAGREMT
ncbi:hypothetical protein IPZ58_10905 [Streptomyces roseoverticillatus]|uniref:hypothetical protein n=1 Tax=Streptomyces roseoverticillatus TaxID=66429 RepID=UPI001F3BC1A3|nr:hypothetical protein [Streptomyces roseoverticillatus]MCF3102094.1 hypothetical protein [Streptomyces roseoverticillatus]